MMGGMQGSLAADQALEVTISLGSPENGLLENNDDDDDDYDDDDDNDE